MDANKPFEPHPNLSKEINDNIAKSEIDGGAWIKDLKPGKSLKVQTKNTLYTIHNGEGGLTIQGHPKICPEPSPVSIHGSTWGGSMLKIGFIGRGMYMEFSTNGQQYVTSMVQEVTEQ